ncbi:MAG TPA: SRPBCC domain-containing protein [Devosia sp.]|nr:SRPBCC domain-containing protein [Devosia sp.]
MHDLKITAPKDEPVIVMTRTFNAPRELVWKAISEPEHAVRWFGPHGHRNKVLKWDWKVGGEWSIETTIANGDRIVFFGDYREIEKPKKVTQTFSFDQLPPGVHSLDTLELIEKDGKTIYQATSRMPDFAARDGMLASGMETGVVEGFERLDAMLEDFKATTPA